MTCEYCGTPSTLDTNCKNCGAPAPVRAVVRSASVTRSLIETTTFGDETQRFVPGVPRATVTLDVDPHTAFRLITREGKK